jgi:hypothetical protein
MIGRGLLIPVLMGALLLSGCAWEGGASQPVQPGGMAQKQGGIAPKPAPVHGVAPEPRKAAPIPASPTPPAATAAAAPAAALMNPAQPGDVVGSWQMVQLPPNFLQPTRPTAPFSNPWQWFIFSPLDGTGTGRIGLVSRADPPRGIVTDAALADAWAAFPTFDTYRMTPGTVSVTPVAITGWSAQGTQTWQTYVVTSGGAMLGMQALPGDMLMVLTGNQGEPLYYRMLRRVPRAAQ